MARQFFVKLSSIKFHENLSSRSRVVMCVQTDRQNDFNMRSAFWWVEVKLYAFCTLIVNEGE
jgi:hypothetical protein